jgi:hypothetical protein
MSLDLPCSQSQPPRFTRLSANDFSLSCGHVWTLISQSLLYFMQRDTSHWIVTTTSHDISMLPLSFAKAKLILLYISLTERRTNNVPAVWKLGRSVALHWVAIGRLVMLWRRHYATQLTCPQVRNLPCQSFNSLLYMSYITSVLASSRSRISRPFPEEASLRCRSGTTALKGNLPEKASSSFQDALALNPYLWEAFEGLCALGKSYVTFKVSFLAHIDVRLCSRC